MNKTQLAQMMSTNPVETSRRYRVAIVTYRNDGATLIAQFNHITFRNEFTVNFDDVYTDKDNQKLVRLLNLWAKHHGARYIYDEASLPEISIV